jgi:ubiquinone/menaquinone biosynthesis C-methylase UbiE
MASASTENASASQEEWTPGLGGERVVEGVHYGWLMKDHLARYHFASKYTKGKKILDVATGTGYGANILRKNGAADVTAVDREQRALDYARERYGEDGLKWVKADAYALPFEDGSFDAVVSFETIEHMTEPERFLMECKRLVKPGGLYLVSTPENEGGNFVSDYHELEFSLEEFRSLLTKHFPNVEILGQRREIVQAVKVMGSLPAVYYTNTVSKGKGSHGLYTLMDRLNKAPNYLFAWMLGLGEAYRDQIHPIDKPLRYSRFLEPHYFIMIGICQKEE